MITESKLWSWINQIQKSEPTWHLFRIESSTINGIPDVNACIDGKEFWIELKCNRGKNIGISKYQFVWHLKRNKCGGKCFILHLHSKERRLEVFEVRESRSRSRCPSITNLGSVQFEFTAAPGLSRVRESLMLMRGL
jgi:hypothetical protein